MRIVIKYLNFKSENWYPLKITYESNKVEIISSHFGLHQLFTESTHTLKNSFSCTDLIFTSQPNLGVNQFGSKFGISFFSSKLQYQIVIANFYLKIYYPQPYKREYGITKTLMRILSDVHLMNLDGNEP